MYSICMDEARCGAVCPGKFVPVLKTLGKCSCLRAKPAHISGHLPDGIHRQLEWLKYALKGGWTGFVGSPADTWSDVEQAFSAWIREQGLVEKYQQLCTANSHGLRNEFYLISYMAFRPTCLTTHAPNPSWL